MARRSHSVLALILACFAGLFAATAVYAVQPDEILADPALEARARELSAGLRCLVCQNQSIDDSDAPLARDLRLLVRERLKAGDSNEAVTDFVVARYGEFVLLKPVFSGSTVILWLLPPLVLAGACLAALRAWKARAAAQSGSGAEAPLTSEEKARLDRLLKSGGSSNGA